MAVLKPTYPTKTNNPSDPANVRQFQYEDANELKSVGENHADHIETILAALGISEGTGSVGTFTSLTVLQAAYPTGANGAYAIIDDGLGGTPSVATFNEGTDLWELATPDESVIWVANQAALPGTGIANKLYVALDSGIIYYWDSGQYNTAGGTVTVVTKYILNNGSQYKTEKGFGNIGTGFEVGDEIFYRDPTTKKRAVYYVKNGSLTLPADFSDTSKLDKYNESGPLL